MDRILSFARTGVLMALVPIVAAGCGGAGGGGGGDDGGSKADLKNGKTKFQANCKSCHTLADANATGTFGTNLDLVQPSEERVLQQIEVGGGGMPAELVKGKDAEDVAAYVAAKAGQE